MTLPPVPPEIVAAVTSLVNASTYLGSTDYQSDNGLAAALEEANKAESDLLALIQQALAAEGERAIRAAVERLRRSPGYLEIGPYWIHEDRLLAALLPEPKGGGA